MEHSRTQHDETRKGHNDGRCRLDDGHVRGDDASGASLRRARRPVQPDDVTCEALHLALSALQIDIAWHAGA